MKISQPKSVQSSDIRKIPDQIAVIMPDPFRRYLTLSDRKYNLKPRLGGSPAETMMRKLYRMSLYQVDAQFKKNHSSVMLLAKETDVVKLSSEFILCNKIMTMLNNSFNLTDPLVRKKSEMYAGIEFKMRSGIAYIECALLTIIPSGVFDPSIKWSVPAPKELVEKFLFK